MTDRADCRQCRYGFRNSSIWNLVRGLAEPGPCIRAVPFSPGSWIKYRSRTGTFARVL